jgi:hypothetical protein
MNELSEMWSEKLAAAIQTARETGRHDVADYLSLKAANDLLRATGIQWLFGSFIEAAGEANRHLPALAVEREDPHNFAYGGANLVGAMLRLRLGVRCLTVEAGWTRTPADGFMRGGALARAHIRHFGMPKAAADVVLLKRTESPVWSLVDEDRPTGEFTSAGVTDHLRVLIG